MREVLEGERGSTCVYVRAKSRESVCVRAYKRKSICVRVCVLKGSKSACVCVGAGVGFKATCRVHRSAASLDVDAGTAPLLHPPPHTLHFFHISLFLSLTRSIL